MSTYVRADWSNVTLGEYKALDILRRDNPETLLNAYWDRLHAGHRVIECMSASEPSQPGRLTPAGSEWLAELHRTVTESSDEREHIRAAGEFLKGMGTLLTVNVHRALS